MAPRLSKVAVLFAVAASCASAVSTQKARVHGSVSAGKAHGRAHNKHTSSREGSLDQIVETLRNVRKSIGDMGREEDSLSSEAASRCSDAMQFFGGESQTVDKSVDKLHADLAEQEAMVAE